MKSAPRKAETAQERRARVAALVAKAKAAGEKVPAGVKLIGFRGPTATELAHAKTLVPTARRILARRSRAAA
ncbi:MAG: hypothetical protein H0W66_11090 [Chthoniobacterales bacterium]|nr:hypothetical protein [Chthoniobacterales bacterium]